MEEKKVQEINNILDDFDLEVIEMDNVQAVPSTAASGGNGSSTSTCGSSSSSTCSSSCA
ncbi:thiazolylpeptide-type bacteriocin [Clostridium manihotivorum]|uniref:Thiazolylpeptide-type bacteriocin n=1 Tax=Clostridium manihotivorum TaxID=2320868 RepID=A0A3R5QWE5_9CLOT|nr:thiazolylpeptide-type bacteriocin [Clostridium manihotivorum]QAA31107.1 thiazolylpeptide-type bacteriocin [Clostridium manihotivorum]